MVYWEVNVELYVVSATYWCIGLWQVRNLFEGLILVPSSIKSFSSVCCAKEQMK